MYISLLFRSMHSTLPSLLYFFSSSFVLNTVHIRMIQKETANIRLSSRKRKCENSSVARKIAYNVWSGWPEKTTNADFR